VILKPGVPKRLHFKDDTTEDRQIQDRYFNVPRTVKSLIFLVDRVDGASVDKTFSVLSQKLINDLAGYMENKKYRNYEFTLVKDGPGTVPPRIVSVTPYP